MTDKVIRTKNGDISGVGMQGYTIFKGVPYAKPPVGDLRWKAPQKLEPWEGVYRAEQFGTTFDQNRPEEGSFYYKEFYWNPDYITPLSEESLYLNIWVPEGIMEKVPVAFWIHGGAFSGGCGHEMEFDGEAYCKKGVILVTINYRVGPLGFLSHPWLSAENEAGISGNYGILDQIAALDWVYENIGAFGGDPSKITIFGQSAGSMSVQTLVSSPLTRGKIAGAILQSAGGYQTGLTKDRSLAEAERIGEELVELVGAHSLEELRKLPAQQLNEKAGELFIKYITKGGLPELPFAPVIDGYVLTEGYTEVVDRGHTPKIPYMVGLTKNDIGCENGEKNKLYYGCIDWSLKQEETGNEPSYVYYFTRQLPGDDKGAFHSAELWYMFGTLDRCWRPLEERDHALSKEMVAYWTNFMKYGDPNGEGLDKWQPCSRDNQYIKEFC